MVVNTNKQHKSTPQKLYEWADRRYGPFDVDVAAEAWNTKCAIFYNKAQDGLESTWIGRVWCNPPWDNIEPWVRKAIKSVKLDRTAEIVVMLLPTRTGQNWFTNLAQPHASTIHYVRGRIRFDPPPGYEKGSGGFEDCALFVFELPLLAKDLNT